MNRDENWTIPKKLQGQVAIITGAGRGIGAATALQLAKAGASIVLAARSADQLDVVVQQIVQMGGRAVGVEADISDPMQVEEIVESAIDQFSRVDMLLNNAGVVWPLEEAMDADPDEWAYNIHVNLVAPFYLIRNVLPLMQAQKTGRILNVGSGAGNTPIPGMSAYCAAKAGMEMMTKTVAAELVDSGIAVNYLIPGMVDTEMQSDIRSVDTSETKLDFDHWHSAHQDGRLLEAEHVANYITWLLGPWSGNSTGKIYNVHDPEWQRQVQSDFQR